jgi:hypothetical protein
MANDITPYAAFGSDRNELRQENMGQDASLSFGDIEDIEVPTGGDTTFVIPSAKGDTRLDTIKGVIIAQHDKRAKYDTEYDPANESAPACYSTDGYIGVGDPGGQCSECPDSKWDAEKGGYKCGSKKVLYFVPEGRLLPLRLELKSAALGRSQDRKIGNNYKTYMKQLFEEGVPYYAVVSAATARKDKSVNGRPCTRVDWTMVETIPAEYLPGVKAYSDNMKALLN